MWIDKKKKVKVGMLYVGTLRNNTKHKTRGSVFLANYSCGTIGTQYHFQNLKVNADTVFDTLPY